MVKHSKTEQVTRSVTTNHNGVDPRSLVELYKDVEVWSNQILLAVEYVDRGAPSTAAEIRAAELARIGEVIVQRCWRIRDSIGGAK